MIAQGGVKHNSIEITVSGVFDMSICKAMFGGNVCLRTMFY